MFANVLIANRGEIAFTIIRTARPDGASADRLHTPPTAGRYSPVLPTKRMRSARARTAISTRTALSGPAKKVGADRLHLGYGFLSENADFAEGCAVEAGVVFVGLLARGNAR